MSVCVEVHGTIPRPMSVTLQTLTNGGTAQGKITIILLYVYRPQLGRFIINFVFRLSICLIHVAIYSWLVSHYFCLVAGLDYDVISVELTFSASTTNQLCESIAILNDDVLEENEILPLKLTTSELAISLNPKRATITIIDNDCE